MVEMASICSLGHENRKKELSVPTQVKMVTGDQLAIGVETAKRLRMGKAAFTLVADIYLAACVLAGR